MAASNDYVTNDITVCYVCLEPLKTPRYLPCSHTFCHTCISAHIQSACQECEQPLGFPCRICRAFVPAPGEVRTHPLQEWAEGFPENAFLAKCVEKRTTSAPLPCGPCETEGEEETADSWCLECRSALCVKCIKSHKKFKALELHQIVSLSNSAIVAAAGKFQMNVECCEKHSKRKVEFVCKIHQALCCSLCALQEHYDCKQFSTIEEAAEIFSDEMKMKLMNEVDQFSCKIDALIKGGNQNIAEIEEKTDNYTEEIEKTSKEMIDYLKNLKEEHLSELAKISKETKQKLERSVGSFEQRKSYLSNWKDWLLSNAENQTKEEVLIRCLKLKSTLKAVKKLPMIEMNFNFSAEMCNGVEKIKFLGALVSFNLTENRNSVNDIGYSKGEFKIPKATMYGGGFLSNGQLMLCDYSGSRCKVCDEKGSIIQEIKLAGAPWDILIEPDQHIIVTIPDMKKIVILQGEPLAIVRTVTLTCKCRGISRWDEKYLIGTRGSIEEYSLNFDHLGSRSVDISDDIVVDSTGNILYASNNSGTVTKEDKEHNIMFTYKNSSLAGPFGLAINQNGLIFVNGRDSDNIHFLSEEGKLLRIFDIQSPCCIKFEKNSQRFFVVCDDDIVKLFELL